jgi:glucose-1-phosphate thymidylyltransferase
LCAGLGTRLRPHTLTRPKALLTVAGRPVLAHILDKLLELEANPRFAGDLEFIFVIGHLGEQIVGFVQRDYLAQGRLRAQFVEQAQPLGSGDAVSIAREMVFATAADPDLLVIYTDTLFDFDFNLLSSLPPAADGIVFCREAEDIQNYGAVILDEVTGYVARLVEKPQTFVSNLAVVSPYYFASARKLYAALDEQIARQQMMKGEYYLTEAVQIMIEQGAKLTSQRVSLWLDTGTFENILATNRALLDLAMAHDTPQLRPVGTSLIVEPCFIAEGVTMEHSVIGPHVSIGPGAVIKQSIVADSIVEDGALIADLSLRGSIIGRGAVAEGQPAEGLSLGDYSKG